MFILNIFYGSIRIPSDTILRILTHGDSTSAAWYYIVWENRIPQAITATVAGASLSTCGLLLQTIFRNPLAGPSILGIDSGANLGVAIVMLFLGGSASIASISLGGYMLLVAAAMMGAAMVLAVLLVFSARLRSHTMLLITGIMVSYIAGSIISLLNFRASAQGVQSFMIWGMGNFSSVSTPRMPLFCTLCAVGLLGAIMLIKPLDALLLGDRYATNLGFHVRHMRTWLLLITGLLTATTTAFCGPISFLGLAVPHLSRMLLGTTTHRTLLPGTILIGSVLALMCNLISNMPSGGTLIPINVITPCIGAPVVLYVILRRPH